MGKASISVPPHNLSCCLHVGQAVEESSFHGGIAILNMLWNLSIMGAIA